MMNNAAGFNQIAPELVCIPANCHAKPCLPLFFSDPFPRRLLSVLSLATDEWMNSQFSFQTLWDQFFYNTDSPKKLINRLHWLSWPFSLRDVWWYCHYSTSNSFQEDWYSFSISCLMGKSLKCFKAFLLKFILQCSATLELTWHSLFTLLKRTLKIKYRGWSWKERPRIISVKQMFKKWLFPRPVM